MYMYKRDNCSPHNDSCMFLLSRFVTSWSYIRLDLRKTKTHFFQNYNSVYFCLRNFEMRIEYCMMHQHNPHLMPLQLTISSNSALKRWRRKEAIHPMRGKTPTSPERHFLIPILANRVFRLGLHWPPIIQHLHVHVMSPPESMSWFSKRIIFRPNSYWFVSVSSFSSPHPS